MAKEPANIINFQDYLKKQQSIKLDQIEAIIAEQRAELRRLDAKVINLLRMDHKQKDVQSQKDISVILEDNLVYLSDWLEDRIAEEKNEATKAMQLELLKQCGQLMTRNERIKKNIADAMTASRYQEGKESIDPIKVAGFLIASPLAVATLTKTFLSDKPEAAIYAGQAGAVVGLLLAFHYQARQLFARASKAIAQSPRRMKSLKYNLRSSAFAITLRTSVVVSYIAKSETRYPERNALKPRTYIAAEL